MRRAAFAADIRPVQIRRMRSDHGLRLVLQGDLDIAGAPGLEEAVEALGPDAGDLILDLRAVTFVDAHGLRAVLAARSTSEARGGHMAFVRGPKEVERVFALTGMDCLVDGVRHPSEAASLRREGRRAHPLARWARFHAAGAGDERPTHVVGP